MREIIFLLAAFLISSCGGIRSVQLQPPTVVPPGLIVGYGAEKIGGDIDKARQSAYLKALDDLLTRGPLVVSKSVEAKTTAVGVHSVTHTLQSKFKLYASRVIHPTFFNSGIQDGFAWVMVGTTEADIEDGWSQFLAWREQKREQASELFRNARGSTRSQMLQAALTILEEIGAADDMDTLYFQVKNARNDEGKRNVGMELRKKQLSNLVDSGYLSSAERILAEMWQLGLDEAAHNEYGAKIQDRRSQAVALTNEGDKLLYATQLDEAYGRYSEAYRLDQDNREISNKIYKTRKARAAALIAAGDKFFSNGQLAEALARFKQALKLDRHNVEIQTKILLVERTIDARFPDPRVRNTRSVPRPRFEDFFGRVR